jgi:hypothetical protein
LRAEEASLAGAKHGRIFRTLTGAARG